MEGSDREEEAISKYAKTPMYLLTHTLPWMHTDTTEQACQR